MAETDELPCRMDGTNKSAKDGSCLRCKAARTVPCAGTTRFVHYGAGLPGALCGDHSPTRKESTDLSKVSCPRCRGVKWKAIRERKG